MNNNDIPVLLLTGYLGSGKTTLLNRILTNKRGIRFAVIVNDIGEVNIDADLIAKGGIVNESDENLVALQNGCICCTLKMDLVKQLQGLIEQKQFDYIVIEASGICEPAPIAQTICSMPEMIPQYQQTGMPRLDCIVSVVDALRLKDEFQSGLSLTNPNLDEDDIENLVIQQIEFCNIILLNKAHDIKASELGRIKEIIKAIQPKAQIIECDYCDVELEKLLNTGLFNFDDVAGSAAWIQEVENHHDDDDDDDNDDDEHEHEHEHEYEHEHHHHHHHHHDEGEAEEYGIGTYVYQNRKPFSLELFDDFVARRWPSGIIRAKGMVYFDDERNMCYVFEQAGKQVSLRQAGQWFATMPQEELQELLNREPKIRAEWDDTYGDRMQKLVFIGQNLNKKAIKQALDDCIA